MDKNHDEEKEAKWKAIYKAGAVAAILTVLVAVAEIGITFLPGGGRETTSARTVIDWFTQYQTSPLMAMRNLGLVNIFLVGLSILVNYALYAAHRRVERPLAGLALIVSLIGVAVFFATNRALPMLALSNQYAAAASDTQRALLMAAGSGYAGGGREPHAGHLPGVLLLRDCRHPASRWSCSGARYSARPAGLWVSWRMGPCSSSRSARPSSQPCSRRP